MGGEQVQIERRTEVDGQGNFASSISLTISNLTKRLTIAPRSPVTPWCRASRADLASENRSGFIMSWIFYNSFLQILYIVFLFTFSTRLQNVNDEPQPKVWNRNLVGIAGQAVLAGEVVANAGRFGGGLGKGGHKLKLKPPTTILPRYPLLR